MASEALFTFHLSMNGPQGTFHFSLITFHLSMKAPQGTFHFSLITFHLQRFPLATQKTPCARPRHFADLGPSGLLRGSRGTLT